MHPLQPRRQGLRRQLRHVGDGHQVGGHVRGQGEGGLARRLVPAGEDPPGIRGLELGEQRGLRRLARLVVQMEQTRGLGRDPAVIGDRQGIAARLQGLGEVQGHGLGLGVHHPLRRHRQAGGGAELDRLEGQVRGVQLQLAGGGLHRHVDPHPAGEGVLRQIGHQGQVVVGGGRIGRQDHPVRPGGRRQDLRLGRRGRRRQLRHLFRLAVPAVLAVLALRRLRLGMAPLAVGRLAMGGLAVGRFVGLARMPLGPVAALGRALGVTRRGMGRGLVRPVLGSGGLFRRQARRGRNQQGRRQDGRKGS